MSFDQALRLTSILLASASFIGLALGASLPEWLVLLTGSALIVVLLRTLGVTSIDRLAAAVPLSTATWNILLVIGFLGFWIDMLWISGELLPAGIHFLLILMVVKLFNLQLRRDYLHLYAISLMAILASATLTTDLWYLPIFLAYLLSGVWTLLLFQLTKKSDDPTGTALPVPSQHDHQQLQNRITPELFWLANGLALGTFALTLVIFFAIPRVSAGFFQKGYGDSIRTSGFSEAVDLGTIGPVKRDPSIVMRVELPERNSRTAGPFYLRGMAYDRYDGRSWTNQLTHRRVVNETALQTFLVRRNPSRAGAQPGPVIRQNILLEPLDTTVLFAAPFAETVTGRFLTIQTDSMGGLFLPFPSTSRIEYSVDSRLNLPSPADLHVHSAIYPESFARHFLQTPGQSERIAALAREITQSKHTLYDKALAIEQYLSRNFRYSLDAPAAGQANPIEEFLFVRKTGYCEHYATAMVVLLRAIGIPARLVTGFLATEWNEYGNYYLVRQQDAHAWVEIHLPQSGWITMDPTPPVIENPADPGWQALGRLLDSLRLRWNRFVVQYSAADQIAVVRELKAGGESARTKAWDSISAFLAPLATGLGKITRSITEGNPRPLVEFAGLALAGLGAIVWLTRKRPWTSAVHGQVASVKDRAMVLLYEKMLWYLARNGMPKRAATPPLEFLRLIQQEWAEAGSAVATITELYCRSRFGHILLTKEELSLAQKNLRQLLALERP